MCHVAWEELRQPKVCYLGAEVSVKENVAGFDITVDDRRPNFFVKVCEPIGYTDADFHPCPPVKDDATSRIT